MDRVLDKRYRITEPIGVGGSSQVYLAHDDSLGRDVAIKVLDPHAAGDPAVRKLFVREAQALAKLSHPNVVAVYDVGEVDRLPYIVMEHLPGMSVKQHIERQGPLSVNEAVRLAVEIANGLAFAHSRGIVHADLKPSNVLLDQDRHAKIADFGIARLPQEEASTPQLFATAMYVSPERVEGKPLSPASDIYGLGLVLYEMLVGRPPFTSASPSVLLRDHVVRQPVPPSHLRQSLPRELDSVVMKCLAKDPALRYSRASDVAKALAALENVGSPLATTRVEIMNEPLQGMVPSTADSPVVALLQAFGTPIRRGFFSILGAAPAFAVMLLAGFEALPAALVAAGIVLMGLTGQLGAALGIAWAAETFCIFLFAPLLGVVFGLIGLFLWIREVPPERTIGALALPLTAPLGLAPALILSLPVIQGLAGVATVLWGAAMSVLLAAALGQQSLGGFVLTGFDVERNSLFDGGAAAEARGALLYAVRPGVDDRFSPLLQTFAPDVLVSQVGSLIVRILNADGPALAAIASWLLAAAVVWTMTRLVRGLFDAMFASRRWFATFVFATAFGVFAGAAVLYMLFGTLGPISQAPGHAADAVLFLSAFAGAVLALAVGVVISATEKPEVEEEAAPTVAARRIAGR